jgi:segregation and condensation protein B
LTGDSLANGLIMAESGKAQILPFTPPVREIDSSDEQTPRHHADFSQHLRVIEAILFASTEPVPEKALVKRLPDDVDIGVLMSELKRQYESRGVVLVKVGSNWAFRTADDLGFLLNREAVEPKKLSRAALEVLAIVAYHQPATRAEIEEIRGVATSKGTLDVLLETGWVRMRGRRRSPGKPITYGTSDAFLDHFGLEELTDLPGLDEMKGAGLLNSALPKNFQVPVPDDDADLREDEEPFSQQDLEELGIFPPGGASDEDDSYEMK